MNPALAKRAKEYAARTGKSFTDLVETAVAEHLARQVELATKRKVKLPVSGVRGKPLTHEQIQRAIEQADLEYDLKKAGLPWNEPNENS
jgi:hypothetical protein